MEINMGKQQHDWVTFYNPRNGRVRIKACDRCGLAKGLETPRSKCKDVSLVDHKMRKAGWMPLLSMPDFATG